jgi:hypothetical protein
MGPQKVQHHKRSKGHDTYKYGQDINATRLTASVVNGVPRSVSTA